METVRNSDWLRAVRLIRNSANFCYHSANFCYQCKFVLSVQISVITFWREKTFTRKNKYGGQGSTNSVNISLKCEVNSTLILPVKCPLTKLEES